VVLCFLFLFVVRFFYGLSLEFAPFFLFLSLHAVSFTSCPILPGLRMVTGRWFTYISSRTCSLGSVQRLWKSGRQFHFSCLDVPSAECGMFRLPSTREPAAFRTAERCAECLNGDSLKVDPNFRHCPPRDMSEY